MAETRGNGPRGEPTAKRRCRRCLLEEFDQETYIRTLKEHIERTPARERTPEADYARRLETCKACDFLEAGTCMACGCYVELRAASRRGRCAYKKW